jgi:hypothetical protein
MTWPRIFTNFWVVGLCLCCQRNPDAAGNGSGLDSSRQKKQVAMSSTKDDSPTNGTTSPKDLPASTHLSFRAGELVVAVYKVADRKHRPFGDYTGKEAFEQAIAVAPGGDLVLCHLAVAPRFKAARLVHRWAGQENTLSEMHPIYRMPNSALRTFVVVDLDRPGVLVATSPDGSTGSLDLSLPSANLAALPLSQHPESRMISYPGLLHGKL